MSNSRTRNFRRRADDDDENTSANHNATTTPTHMATKTASVSTVLKSSSTKPKKLLSFADDEEDEQKDASSCRGSRGSSRLSVSSSAHRVSLARERLAPANSNVVPQSGAYSKEVMLELQKNTRKIGAPSSRPPPPPDSSSEPKVILKGLLKPQAQENLDAQATSNSEDEHGDVEGRLGMMGIGRNKYGDSEILDKETIKAIRAKRERMRNAREAAPDYISLDSGSNHGAAEGLSDEEPEFQTRIAMIGTKKKGIFENTDDGNEKRVYTGAMKNTYNVPAGKDVYDNADAVEDDEEDRLWEEEQFRKGLGKRMDDSSTSNVMNASGSITTTTVHSVQQQQSFPYAKVSSPSIGGLQGLDGMSMPQQAEIAMKALQDNLTRLKDSHSRTVSSLTKTDENLSDSLLNITALEQSLSAAGERFIFMQKLREFVSVICEFLQYKAPFIEELEEQMQKLHEDRALAILEKRSADKNDDMMEVEAAVEAAMMVFTERGNSYSMIAAAKSAAQAAAAAVRQPASLSVKLDEFGRDINLQKRMDMTRRDEARKSRKARFEAKRLKAMEVDSSSQKIEGESSTDESDNESTAFQSNHALLLETADDIFSDASEEFSQLSSVKQRLEVFKKNYPSSYRDAYMSLSVPAIFSPYVRLELLKWDPLHEDADFFEMNWHSVLFNYGMSEDEISDANTGDADADADANLIPELVEKVALPILHHEIVHCWDILSTQQTLNVVSATSLVINYISASSGSLTELLKAIHTRLADVVAHTLVPTWSPLVVKAVPGAAGIAAYRFGMSVRLMRNICSWKDILALTVLEKLALDELLCGIILPHLRSIATDIHDAITRTERLVDSLSGLWSGPSVTGSNSAKLQPLVDYVLSLGKTLEKKYVSGVSEIETSGLARRLKKMLVDLNEYDKARGLARTFRLKEAL